MVLLGIWILAGLNLLPGGSGPSDAIALSCVETRSCFALDTDGAIYSWSSDRSGWRLRHRNPSMSLKDLVFTGMLQGVALDADGRLWRTRDGARTFESVPGLSVARAIALARGDDVLALLSDGRIVKLGDSPGELGRIEGQPLALAARGRAMAALARGRLYLGSASSGRDNDMRAHSVKEDACRIVLGERAAAIFYPDRIEIRALAGNEGRVLLLPREASAGACPKDGLFLDERRLLLIDTRGELWLALPERNEIVPGRAEGGWSRLARVGRQSILLVGPRGRRAIADMAGEDRLRIEMQEPGRPGIRDIRVDANSGKVWRALGDGSLDWFSPAGNGGRSPVLRLPGPPLRLCLGPAGEMALLAQDGRLWISRDFARTWTEALIPAGATVVDAAWTRRDGLVALGTNGMLISSPDAGKTWQAHPVSGRTGELRRIQSIRSRMLVAVGESRQVLVSGDGGRSFHPVLSGAGTLNAMFFLDEREGWVGGEDGAILHTTDGGASWTGARLPEARTVVELWFDRKLRGAALAGGRLYLSHDGGTNWHLLDSAAACEWSAIACTSGPRCFLGDACGRFMVGDPWSP